MTTERKREGRAHSFRALLRLGVLGGLCFGALGGGVGMALSYLLESRQLGGSAAQMAPAYVPAAAVFGGVLGMIVGAVVVLTAWLGGVVTRRVRHEALGVALGGALGAGLSVWLVTANLFGLPFEVVSTVFAAFLAAVGLSRTWVHGTVLGRRTPAESNP